MQTRSQNQLDTVLVRLAGLYTNDEARAWLEAKHPLLAGRSPIEAAGAGEIDRVLSLVEGLGASAYT